VRIRRAVSEKLTALFILMAAEKKTMKSETNPNDQTPKRDCFAALAMTRVVIKIILPLDFWPSLAYFIQPFFN